jgi:hypothetical protein
LKKEIIGFDVIEAGADVGVNTDVVLSLSAEEIISHQEESRSKSYVNRF